MEKEEKEAVEGEQDGGLVVCALIDLLFRHVKDEGVVNGQTDH